MPTYITRFISNKKEYFFLYSTVSDSPITPALTEDELRNWSPEYNPTILNRVNLDNDLKLARLYGASSNGSKTFEEAVKENAAGAKDQNLTPTGVKRIVLKWRKNYPFLSK